MECWVYLNETPSSSDGIFAKRTDVGTFGGVLIYFSGLTPNFYATLSGSSWGIAFSSSIAATLNAWTHLAFTRSGSTWTIYVNGVSGGTGNSSGTVPNNTSAFVVGAYSSDGNATYLFPAGYISNVRVVKGTAIVPPAGGPTAPLTAVPNTSLLLNFTNAGVVDATAKNVLETVGNAQISTTQSKWGGGSINFASASNSNLLGNTPSNWTYLHDGSSWTVEFWLYPTNVSSFQGLICTNQAGSDYIGLGIVISSSGAISVSFTRGVSGSSASFTSSAVLNANQWNYVGITFTNSTKTCAFFINGASAGSSSNTGFSYSSSAPSTPPYIGQTGYPSFPYYFNGYIDDLRITRGIARTITANPTAPFPLQ